MERLIKTLENRTALVFAGVSLVICAIVFGVSLRAESYSAKQMQIQVCDHMLSAAAKLSDHTELTNEQIAKTLAEKDTSDAAKGEQILSAYGFKAGTGRGFEYAYSRSVLPSIIAVVGVLLCAAAGFVCFAKLYSKIKRLTACAENKEKCLEDFSDRELLLLSEQVNKLIAERERSIRQISEEKLYLAQYLQDFSHQIKTPAAGLTLNNEIYRSHPMNKEEMSGYLDRDSVCIERINKLCTQSLKLARLEAGAVEYEIKPNSLSQTAQKACAPLYEVASENNTEISVDIPQDITLECDELWLCEAVSNLVKNACEHTKDGKVTVTAKKTPLSTELFVADNGEGIADEDIPQLFRRFYSKKNESDPSAIGIGMSIAERICEDMGGKMYIQSEVGKGTQIRLEFLQ